MSFKDLIKQAESMASIQMNKRGALMGKDGAKNVLFIILILILVFQLIVTNASTLFPNATQLAGTPAIVQTAVPILAIIIVLFVLFKMT